MSRPYLVIADGDGKSLGLRAGVLLSLTACLALVGKKKIDKYRAVGRPGAGMDTPKPPVKTE